MHLDPVLCVILAGGLALLAQVGTGCALVMAGGVGVLAFRDDDPRAYWREIIRQAGVFAFIAVCIVSRFGV